mgnify:CR=1 FL=1
MSIKVGQRVKWKWGQRDAFGTVQEVHSGTVVRRIKQENVKRNGEKGNPALVIEQDDGDEVLKLFSEVEKF